MFSLSTNVTTHVILLKDKSKKFINKKAYDYIWSQIEKGVDSILIKDWYLSISKISELISIQEYKERFPEINEDLLPAPKLKDVNQLAEERGLGFKGVVEKYRNNNGALKGMIKGMKNFLQEKKIGECKNAEGLLELMEAKLKTRT
jgi:hypothetical protein